MSVNPYSSWLAIRGDLCHEKDVHERCPTMIVHSITANETKESSRSILGRRALQASRHEKESGRREEGGGCRGQKKARNVSQRLTAILRVSIEPSRAFDNAKSACVPSSSLPPVPFHRSVCLSIYLPFLNPSARAQLGDSEWVQKRRRETGYPGVFPIHLSKLLFHGDESRDSFRATVSS